MARYAIPLVLTVLAGCGPPAGQVSGRITIKGEPVGGAFVIFHAENGSGYVYTGDPTDDDGRYRLKFAPSVPGVIPGRYKVVVSPFGSPPVLGPGDPRPNPIIQGRAKLIPAVYHIERTTPLTADVTPGLNTADFDLPASK